SEYFGSCRMKPTRLPRIFCIRFSDAVRISIPSSVIRSALICACWGSNFISARAVSDFPEPDSPTIPSFSWPSDREIPRTASDLLPRLSKAMRRLRISTFILAFPSVLTRVEDIAQPIPEEVERKRGKQDRNRRCHGHPPLLQQIFLGRRNHRPPFGR